MADVATISSRSKEIGTMIAELIQKVGKDGKGMTKLGQDGVSQVPDMETVRGSFFSPVNEQGQKVQGFGNRLGYSDFMNISPF